MAVAEISVEELHAALDRGATLFDVREPSEFEACHVAGAVLIPLQTVPDRVDDFRVADPAYVICRSGPRSTRACEFLAQHGINAVNVAGGMLAWIDRGKPVQ